MIIAASSGESVRPAQLIESDPLEGGQHWSADDIDLLPGRTPRIVEGDLRPDWGPGLGEHILIYSRHQSWLTHGFHKYPAKFFPELPRWAIQRYSRPGDLVLDPFAGSGTVNVECVLSERPSVAVDIDPFARLLTRVKTTPLRERQLLAAHQQILARLKEAQQLPAEVLRAAVPPFPYQDTWFRPYALAELGAIRMAIAGTRGEVQDFFRICLSSIVRAVSNADNNCTRTVVRERLNKRVPPGLAYRLFERVTEINVQRMCEFARVCPPGVPVDIRAQDDARALSLADESVAFAVTSPPYINAVDYPRTHQLETYLLDVVSGGENLAAAKRGHVGTEVVRAAEYRELHRHDVPALDRQLEDLYEVDPRRSYIVYRYFEDMAANFREMRRVLRPGARYVVVVGNNLIRDRVVPTHAYLMAIAEEVGFAVETYFASDVIRHFIKVPRKERINNDWVLALRKG